MFSFFLSFFLVYIFRQHQATDSFLCCFISSLISVIFHRVVSSGNNRETRWKNIISYFITHSFFFYGLIRMRTIEKFPWRGKKSKSQPMDWCSQTHTQMVITKNYPQNRVQIWNLAPLLKLLNGRAMTFKSTTIKFASKRQA